MEGIRRLKQDYPWIQTPVIAGAPMRLIALADLAVEVTKAGGIGFIGAGTDVANLDFDAHLLKAQQLLSNANIKSTNGTLPVGLGFINWGAPLSESLKLIEKYRPAAVWFFAPTSVTTLVEFAESVRKASPNTKIWVQIGGVREAIDVVKSVHPDVLVVQGTDAGGHGRARGASIISLLPEVLDTITVLVKSEGGTAPVLLAAGGIMESRSAAAALTLGASGIVLGTRLLASHEAIITKGYKDEIIRASDGGQTTVRTKVYDNLRGTTGWAETHNARGIINRSYTDAVAGLDEAENKRMYEEEMKKGDAGWGVEARMTTYAGTGVGLVKDIKGAGEIVREVREGATAVLKKVSDGGVAAKL